MGDSSSQVSPSPLPISHAHAHAHAHDLSLAVSFPRSRIHTLPHTRAVSPPLHPIRGNSACRGPRSLWWVAGPMCILFTDLALPSVTKQAIPVQSRVVYQHNPKSKLAGPLQHALEIKIRADHYDCAPFCLAPLLGFPVTFSKHA